jgi:hypothetical protein
MKPGDLVRVLPRIRTEAEAETTGGGWRGRIDGGVDTIFIEPGAIGVVIVGDPSYSHLVTFGDRTCWLAVLSLEALNEAG